MNRKERIKQLTNKFGAQFADFLKEVMDDFFDREEVLETAFELSNLNCEEVILQPKITFDIKRPESDTEEETEISTAERKPGSKLDIKFGGEKDLDFGKELKIDLNSPGEMADMERAIAEVRSGGQSTGRSQELSVAKRETDDTRNEKEIILSIFNLAEQMASFSQRYFITYSFNKMRSFDNLIVKFPEDDLEKVQCSLDHARWGRTLGEIIKSIILQSVPPVRTELLAAVEFLLKQYLQF